MRKILSFVIVISALFLTMTASAQYCSCTNAGGTCITNLTLNTLNNTTTGCSSGNYSTQLATTSLTQGGTYTVSVTCASNAIVSVWIDFNHNFSYEATEWVQPYTSATTGSSIINVPSNAVPGLTGMRVRSRIANLQNGPTDACLAMGSGETEDYSITIVSTTPCSGQPIAGTTTTNNPSPCIGQQVLLGISGNTFNGGLVYQWISSPTGNPGTWVPVTGANGPYYVASLTGNTCFRCIVTCTTNNLFDTSSSLCINPGIYTPYSTCYCPCTHVGTSPCITNVNFGSLNYTTSGCSGTSNYNFFTTASIPNLVQGQSYMFTVSTTVNAITSVWIDYNHNAVFEPSEWYQPDISATLGDTLIQIPLTSLPGQTRMRVRSRLPGNQNGSGAACIAMGSGETEDYVINILPAANHDPAVTALNTPTGNCFSANSNCSVTLTNFGQFPINCVTNPITVYLNINGPNGFHQDSAIVSTGILQAAASNTINVIIPGVNLYAGGLYTINTSLKMDTTGSVYNGLLQDDSLASPITIQNYRPTPGPVYNLCQGSTIPFGQGLTVSGCATPILDSVTINFTLSPNGNIPCYPTFYNTPLGSCLVGTANLPSIPNPTFLSAQLKVTNLSTTNGGFANQIRLPLFKGSVPIPNTSNVFISAGPGSTLTTSTNFTFQYTIPTTTISNIFDSLGANGILKLGYYSTWLGNSTTNGFLLNAGGNPTVASLKLVYTYVPNNYAWFDTPSGGTSLSSTSPFNPLAVSNSVISNSNTPGNYVFWVACGPSPACRVADTLRVNPTPVANDVTLSTCETSVASNTGVFNLNSMNSQVNATFAPVYYYDQGNFLPIPTPSAHSSGTTNIFATVTNPNTGCSDMAVVHLKTDTLPDIQTVTQGLICSPATLDAANLINYNFSVIPSNSTITYWSNAACTIPHPNPSNITTAGSVYFVVATNTSPSCKDTAEGIINISAATNNIANQFYIGSFTYSSPTSIDPVSTAVRSYTDGQNGDIFTPDCKKFVEVTDYPNGTSLGSVSSDLWIYDSVLFHNGQPYVKRVYRVTPTNQDSAQICLYYLQEDFNEYNVIANQYGWPELANPSLSNLAISKVDNGDINTPGHTVTVLSGSDLNSSYNATNEVWKVCFQVDSFSYFYVHSMNLGNAALGIQWKEFNAIRNEQFSELNWITSMEKNSAYFVVERSHTGNLFSEISNHIASKSDQGYSATDLSYQFTDKTPYDGHNYYRIRQVDLDGKTQYSKIVDVYFGSDAKITVYPNPVKEVLQTTIEINKATQASIELSDASGRVVRRIQVALHAGTNRIDVPVQELSNGIYLMKISNDKGIRYTQTIRKQGE